MTVPSMQDFITHNENKLFAEIAELKSQVEDLQEELRETRTQSNLKDWEIKFLKEDVKRLNAKTYEKRHYLQTEDTEED
jgi:peptidoglycan hydrolase CwlO-like protein